MGTTNWGVGQLADRLTVNQEVGGSSPPAPALPAQVQHENSVRSPRWVRRRIGLAGAVAAFAILVLAPSELLAHARLIGSSPRAGEQLATSPAQIRLVFSESLMMGVARIVLTGPLGDTVSLAPPVPDSMGSHIISAGVRARLTNGLYTVHWVAAGRDGHPERGSFSFTMLGSAPGPSVTTNRDTAANEIATDAGAPDYPLTIARWVGFLALFSVIGAVAFKLLVLSRVERVTEAGDPFVHVASIGAATYGLFASVALVIATVIKLYGQSLAMRDVPPEAILLTTGWGWAWSVQMVACLIAVAAFVIAHRGTGQGWSLAELAAALLAVTPAATGHAIGSDEALFAVPIDVVHILAGCIWVGTLAVILIVGIGAATKTPGTVSLGTRVATMINAFSPLALGCGAAIVATGGVASLIHLEPFSSLWTSTYGKVLIVKLALVSLLFVVGAWNWRRVKPTLGGDEGVEALRLSARVELAVSALVLAVTAVLVALPLPE